MKKLIAVFSFLLLITLTSCSGNKAEGVAKKFLELTGKGEFAEAKKYCDEKTGQLLGMADSMLPADKKAELAKRKIDIEIISSEITDDKAKVKYKATGDGEASVEKTLDLVKVDGEWKVSIDKEHKEGMGNKGVPAPPAPVEPAPAPTPADSMQ
jgi:hypothetical protein